MPRPFPFALGIGTDICHVVRIFNLLDKQKGSAQHFLRRCLNTTEIQLCKHWWNFAAELDACEKEGPESTRPARRKKFWGLARFMSGRWAAKEAAIKAHTLRRITMHDITIYGGRHGNGESKAPRMTIRGTKEGDEAQMVKVSISHDGEYATAVCLIAEDVELPDLDALSNYVESSTVEDDTALSTEPSTPVVRYI